MAYFDCWTHVYNSPEKYGLEVVKTFDGTDMAYQFDMFVVWKDGDEKWYWGTDSGCSCPEPFGYAKSLDDLNTGDSPDLLAALDDWLGWGSRPSECVTKVMTFMGEVATQRP